MFLPRAEDTALRERYRGAAQRPSANGGNYRDRQRPAKPQVEGREQPDYITIRIPASVVPLALQKGVLYRVHGSLQSREYKENLGDCIKSAYGLTNLLSISDEMRREITHNLPAGHITEVMAERLIQVDKPPSAAGNGRRSDAPEGADGAGATKDTRSPFRPGRLSRLSPCESHLR